MTSRAAENLGKRLERERVRRFVGRAAELELFSTWLEASSNQAAVSDSREAFSVLWVYGPGGIGKSTLLRAFADVARNAGYLLAQIDGGRVMPTPDGIRAAVWESLAAGIDAPGDPGLGQLPARPSVIWTRPRGRNSWPSSTRTSRSVSPNGMRTARAG